MKADIQIITQYSPVYKHLCIYTILQAATSKLQGLSLVWLVSFKGVNLLEEWYTIMFVFSLDMQVLQLSVLSWIFFCF